MTSLALASLTANYTDSEGEEHHENEGEGSPMTTDQNSPPQPTNLSENSNSTPSKPKSVSTTLVSYHDDTIISDDENEPSRSIPESPIEEKGDPVLKENEDDSDVELPPEPPGRCSNELQDKIKKLYDDMIHKGMDMNLEIQMRKEVRNPSIYEKLIQFCEINEFGTNYRPEIYDPLRWSKSSYYDELAKVQKAEMDQREKERKEKTKVEFLMGTAKKVSSSSVAAVSEDDKKRKSKWDQVGNTIPGKTAPVTLTSAASGTKGTVISAFGSLNKKPRI